MADRIKGITIEIGGDTSKLQSALKGVDSQLRETQSALKDINKLLKLDPANTELLTQKQKNLESAISATKERLETLKSAQAGVAEGSKEWDGLQREIIATEQSLDGLQKEYRSFGSVAAQQIKAAGAAMTEFGGKVEEAGQKFKGISTAAGGIVTALAGLGYKAVTSADDLATLAQQTGLSVEELQKMQYASDFVDVSLEDMTGALKKTKSAMTGNASLWESLGVSVKNADGSMRDATDVFFDSLDALSKIENETERDQLAMKLFGKSADQLAGIIDDGGKGLKKYGKEAEELGVILGEDTVNDLADINSELDRVKKLAAGSLGKLGATVAKTLAPALGKLTGLMDKVSDKLSKLTPKQTETILKIAGIVAAIAPVLTIGGKLIKVVGSITSVIGTVVGVLGGPLTIAIAAVIAVGVLLYKNWDKIKETAINLYTKLKSTWENIKTSITTTVTAIKTTVSQTWDNITSSVKTAVTNLKTAVSTAWTGIKNAVKNAMSATATAVSDKWAEMKENAKNGIIRINTTVTNRWNEIKSSVKTAIGSAKTAVSDAWTAIKTTAATKIEGIKSSVSEKFNDIVTKIKSIFSFDFKLPSLSLPTWADIKAKLDTIITNIKNLFKFDWSLPHIKLPHFSVSGGKWPYGLGGEGYLPSISVNWYKRAYDNPMLFTRPTVLQTPSGYKGFGDGHGAEIVLGLNKLRELVGAAGVTVNVYAAPGQSAQEIAYKVQEILVNQQVQRSRAYA